MVAMAATAATPVSLLTAKVAKRPRMAAKALVLKAQAALRQPVTVVTLKVTPMVETPTVEPVLLVKVSVVVRQLDRAVLAVPQMVVLALVESLTTSSLAELLLVEMRFRVKGQSHLPVSSRRRLKAASVLPVLADLVEMVATLTRTQMQAPVTAVMAAARAAVTRLAVITPAAMST